MATRTLTPPGGTWTMTANTAETVNLPAAGVAFVQISNHGTDWIYFTFDGATPTVEGTALALGPGLVETFDIQGSHILQLISATTQKYSVSV
jgi:hypothetical protein